MQMRFFNQSSRMCGRGKITKFADEDDGLKK
jgi:hypothetical protein